MSRRERLERKRDKRREWAESARQRSDASFGAAAEIADQIPCGQPILVGHHSEKRHRRAVDKIQSGMDRGLEHQRRAEDHAAKADGIDRALEDSIFDDDPDAIEQLEARAAAAEQAADKIVELNRALRREVRAGLREGWASRVTDDAGERADFLRNAQLTGSPVYPAYATRNLRAAARRDRKRAEELSRQRDRVDQAEAAGGVLIEGDDWVSVTFHEKPSREVRDSLKGAGFRWRNGAWHGRREDLPEEVEAWPRIDPVE